MRLFHKLALALVLMSLLAMLFPISLARADSPVTFPDPDLAARIRAAIGKPSGDIYQSDLVGLTYLDAYNMNISNLTGLEYCTRLTHLDLHSNQISNISPLSGLTSLRNLWLTNNQIGNISPLSGLTSLPQLDLRYNQISDISPLSGLTSLRDLALRYNQISDISPLSGLTSLTSLELDSNQIGNISPLSGLTSLMYLRLDSNQIGNISALSGLTSLMYLLLTSNQISNISPLSGLTSLIQLDVNYNQISDISPLSGLTSLMYLRLNSNQISDISAVAGLTSLTNLMLGSNQISDIEPLVSNLGLAQGDAVQLDYNPLSCTSINVYIPELQARGVNVSSTATGNTPTGTNVTVTVGGITVTYDRVTAAGCTNVSHTATFGGALPYNYVRRGLFYYIDTTATYAGNVTVGISYDPGIILNPQNLSLFQWWGAWGPLQSHVDTQNHIIYGVLDWVTDIRPFCVVERGVQETIFTSNGNVVSSVDGGFLASAGAVTVNQITVTKDKPTNIDFPYGLFWYDIEFLTPGQSVTITMTFPSPVPVGTQYWKVGATATDHVLHWYSIPIGDDDGDNVITITLTDGGQGDDNYIGADGAIVDAGGPGFPLSSPPPTVVVDTPAGGNVTVSVPGAAITFNTVTGSGTTTVTTSQSNPGGTLPSGFRVGGQFIDISTTATYTGNVTVGISYDPASTSDPQNQRLFHWNGSQWVDVTTSVDTVNHIVYGEVSSFSWFFIGGQWVEVAGGPVPVFPNIYIGIAAVLGAGVLAYFVRRRLIYQR